jgi:hypothetical protein
VSGEYGVQAQVPGDFEAPDKVLYGLTVRQVAIVAGAGGLVWLAWRLLGDLLPLAVIGIGALPVLGVAVVVAVGRRDGIGLDAWLVAAFRTGQAPRRLVAAPEGVPPVPAWAPDAAQGRDRRRRALPATGTGLAPLRLPLERVGDSGVVDAGDGWVGLTAVGTVSFDLRTAAEQYALVESWGRWLNSLTALCRSWCPPARWTCPPAPTTSPPAWTLCRTRRWPRPPPATRNSCSTWPQTGTRWTGGC